LALDGLDYGLVKRWKLKSLLQKRHGVFEIGREYFHPTIGEPYTPIIWASIITGRKPQEHGVKDWWVYGNFLDRLKYLPIIRHIKGKRKLLRKMGLKPRVVSRCDVRCRTIFDVVKPSVAVYVPAYNDPTIFHERLSKVVAHGIDEYIREIWNVHEERKRAVFEALEENREWKLFMAYFDIADLLGHVCLVKRPLKLMKAYLELNKLAGKLQSLAPDSVFLIMTDHCMEPSDDGVTGVHAKHAFWSLNIDIEWEPKDYTDYYHKILEWVRE